jgi:membrane-bound ClpP family serine protease
VVAVAPPAAAGANETEAHQTAEPRPIPAVRVIDVPLPITGLIDSAVKGQLARFREQTAQHAVPGVRPVVVLQLSGEGSNTGAGSEFERCLSLARYVASDALSGLRTVAYVRGKVEGHAVLVVLACEELMMDPEAELGAAGLDEPFVDDALRASYRELAERRLVFPPAVALGMLDPAVEVQRVQTLEGVRYVLTEELDKLRGQTTVSEVEVLIRAGDLGRFTAADLRRKLGFASHLVRDREELARALDVPTLAVEQEPAGADEWKPMRIDVRGPIRGQTVSWMIRSVQQKLDAKQANWLCVTIDSPGGAPLESLRLASFLADLDPARVRTVAYVEREALADAALIALGCQQLVVTPTARLGGSGAAEIRQRDRGELHRSIREVARRVGREEALAVALVDRDYSVHAFQPEPGPGEVRYWGAEESAQQADLSAWRKGEPLDLQEGLSGEETARLRVAQQVVQNFDECRRLYQIEGSLLELRPNWAHLLIQKLASPRWAGLLLFLAMFTLMIELTQPGVGVPGFVSTCCFVLYFWSNMLQGTAGWLEVLMFVTGLVCVLLELLVLPGFGIFGIGGGALIIGSLVLASQTFVIPRNGYQLGQLPSSLLVVVAGMAGAVIGMVVVARLLPQAPVLRWLFLPPPNELDENLAQREAMVDYTYVLGKRGITTTRLVPAGKARFGDDLLDVVSTGEFVPRGAAIRVTEVCGTRVAVEPIEAG